MYRYVMPLCFGRHDGFGAFIFPLLDLRISENIGHGSLEDGLAGP